MINFNKIKKWYLWKPILISALVISAYMGFLLYTDTFEIVLMKAEDIYTKINYKIHRLPKEVNDIVIISIDDHAYEWFNRKWPWDRGLFTSLVYTLSECKPKVIGLNLAFVGESIRKETDELLAQAFKDVNNVVIASYFDETGMYHPPTEIFRDAVRGYGFTNRPQDKDGTIRLTRVFVKSPEGNIMAYSYELKVLEAFLGVRIGDVSFQNGRHFISFRKDNGNGKTVKLNVPSYFDGTMPLNYTATPDDFSTIPILDILFGEIPAETIKDKILLIGMTSRVFYDIHNTPLGAMSGAVMVANGVISYIRKDFIKVLPPFIGYITCVVLGIVIGISTFRMTLFRSALWLALFLLGIVFVNIIIRYFNLVWDFFSTPFVLLTVYGSINIYKYARLVIEGVMLKRLVITDPLTGFATKRYLHLKIQNDLLRAIREKENLCLVIFDIDNFSHLATMAGSEKVDEIIKDTARIIQRHSRKSRGADFLCRYGEKEFCAILHKTPLKGAQIYTNRIQKVLSETAYLLDKKLKVSLSAGIANCPLINTESADVFIKCADAALRRGEKEGSKIAIYHSETDQVSPDEYPKKGETPTEVDLSYIATDLDERNKELIAAIRNLRRAHEDIIKAERLSAMGKITAQVHHELNNPLHNLKNCLEIVKAKVKEDPETWELMQLALKEIERMVKLSHDLRDFYKPVMKEMVDVDVNNILDDMLKMSGKQLMINKIKLNKLYDLNIPKIKGHQEELKQVFLNMIINATEAMPTGGELIIKTDVASNMLEIHIKDTGCGIPRENIDKIFQAFFTTKDDTKGTGLGLFASNQIIKRHGGKIDVQSKVGQGATFIIRLPIISS